MSDGEETRSTSPAPGGRDAATGDEQRDAVSGGVARGLAPGAGGLESLDRNIDVIRGILEQATRERVYREVSFVRLAAVLAQIIVGALLVLAAADVVFDPSLQRPTPTIVKLLFAGVLQLVALTAFLTARRSKDD